MTDYKVDIALPLGILGFTEINELIDQGVIENARRESVNPSSLNVTLGDSFLLEARNPDSVNGEHYRQISFSKRISPVFVEARGSVLLQPKAFCLASIVEKLNLPADIACHVMLRSSAARMGIQHLLAGWADPQYSGNLTLELTNELRYHTVMLRGGDQIMQLIFHRVYPIPEGKGYRGKYSNFNGPQTVLPEYGR